MEIGQPITNGFVFIDGRYIPPPYVVKREGNGVFINDSLVAERIPWPIVSYGGAPVIPELPTLPSSITEKSTLYDKDVNAYLSAANEYFLQRYGKETIAALMKPVYESLPCVERVVTRGDQLLCVAWKDGTNRDLKIITMLVPPERGIEQWTPTKIIERVKSLKEMYERRLLLDDYFLIKTPASNAGRITGTREGALDVLIPLISILETSQTSEEVYTRFKALEIVHFSRGSAKAFFDNRNSITPELKQRIEALRLKQGEQVNPVSLRESTPTLDKASTPD